jgi:hypothetical protein
LDFSQNLNSSDIITPYLPGKKVQYWGNYYEWVFLLASRALSIALRRGGVFLVIVRFG